VGQRHYWFWYLIHTPGFLELVAERFNAVVGPAIQETLVHLEQLIDTYEESFNRNFIVHPILGTDSGPSPEHLDEMQSWREQAEFLVDYLRQRSEHLSEIFNGNEPLFQ
jgi:hypothetical protein